MNEEYDACCYSYGKLSNLTQWLTLQRCRLICQNFSTFASRQKLGGTSFFDFPTGKLCFISMLFRFCHHCRYWSSHQNLQEGKFVNKSECSQPQAAECLLSLSELSQFAAPKNFPFSLAAKIPIFNSLGKPGVDLRNFGDLSTIAAELHFSTLGVWNFAPLLRQHPLCQPNISFTLNILQSVLFSLLNRKASVIHWYISMWRATV